jgi:hypothetical protein
MANRSVPLQPRTNVFFLKSTLRRNLDLTLENLMSSPIRNSSEEQFSVATAEVAALTLANLCFDVQIGICMCLHPI